MEPGVASHPGAGTPEFGSSLRPPCPSEGACISGSGLPSPVVPSSMSMNQRVSLYCWESALSPVSIVNERRAPVTSEVVLRAWLIIASTSCVLSDSWGRYAADSGLRPGTRWVVSTASTRPGDSSSTVWKSDSCRKFRIDALFGRCGADPDAPALQLSCEPPGGVAARSMYGSPLVNSSRLSPLQSRIVRWTVVVGAACAGTALQSAIAARAASHRPPRCI